MSADSRYSRDTLLGVGMLALAAGLAGNTFLGPLFIGTLTYPFSETVYNETLGLEAVSLALVAPLAAIAGTLALRSHPAAAVLALGPAGYSAYMFVQYVVGPQYATYQLSIALHIGLFVLSFGLLLRAWLTADPSRLLPASRRWAAVVLLLAAFVVSRWLPAFAGMVAGEPVPAADSDLTMYWSIFLLDIGFVVPAAVAAVVGLFIRARWASKALYGVVGWFALVPPSVAAMAVVKIMRGDPNASTGDTLVFLVVTVVFWTLAAWLFRRLFPSRRRTGAAIAVPSPSG